MEHLYGKTLLVGKEPGEGRLQIALAGTGRAAVIGVPGSVPNSVSRCKIADGIAHLKIEVDEAGHVTLTNMKPQNVTFVNGSEIVSKRLSTHEASIELGKDHFPIELQLLLHTAEKLVCGGGTPTPSASFNIAPLEQVWNELQDSRHELQYKQRRTNLIRTACGVFTSSAILCCVLIGPVGYVLTAIGVLGNIYSFWGMKNDHSTETLEALTEDFQDHYVCPNPDCKKFLGNISYRLLKRQYNMHCPYCKCEYIEK